MLEINYCIVLYQRVTLSRTLTSDISLTVALPLCRVAANVAPDSARDIAVTFLAPHRVGSLEVEVPRLAGVTLTARNVRPTRTLPSNLSYIHFNDKSRPASHKLQ